MASTRTRKKAPARKAAAAPVRENVKLAAGFTLAEVEALCSIALRFRVKTLKIGTLALSFEESTPIVTGRDPDATLQRAPQVVQPTADEARKATKAGKTQERSDLAAEELDRLEIEDPLAFEKHLMSEDSTDAED